MSEVTQESLMEPAALPLFYKKPVALDARLQARAGLRSRADFGFARGTNAIALTVSEFAVAARCYPIVFSNAAPVVPFAVVGLRDNENLFVNDAGEWHEESYIPAYVRRYPFVFATLPQSDRLLLCVDEGAENFEKESSRPFFVDGKPGQVVQQALRFCETFQAQYEDTLKFGEWLEKHDMILDRVVRAELDDGRVFSLRGFRILNPSKLRALDAAQVADLHQKGWLPLLHFHLQSLHNWGALSRRIRDTKVRAA